MEVCQHLAREISIYEESQEHYTWPEFDAEKIFGWLELIERAGRIRDTNIGMTYSSQFSVQNVLSHLRSEVVRIYGASLAPDVFSEAPHHSLIELIDKVVPPNEPLHFFTTNYDGIIEQILEAKGSEFLTSGRRLRVCTGFNSTRPNRCQPELFRAKPERGERLVHVVKLHGSATWKKDDSGPVETGWGMPTSHDCLLYFGYKSIPNEEPFIALHEILKIALLESDAVVTIGFRFGDPYIRELFDFSMRANSNLRVICILTKQPTANSPHCVNDEPFHWTYLFYSSMNKAMLFRLALAAFQSYWRRF